MHAQQVVIKVKGKSTGVYISKDYLDNATTMFGKDPVKMARKLLRELFGNHLATMSALTIPAKAREAVRSKTPILCTQFSVLF